MVVLGAAAVREHRDFGCGDERHDGRSRLGRAYHADKVGRRRQHLVHDRHGVGRVALVVGRDALQLVPEDASGLIDDLDAGETSGKLLGPLERRCTAEGLEDVESKHGVRVAPRRGRPVGATAGGCQENGECGAHSGGPATSWCSCHVVSFLTLLPGSPADQMRALVRVVSKKRSSGESPLSQKPCSAP